MENVGVAPGMVLDKGRTEDFEIFDTLPKTLRDRMNELSFPLNAGTVRVTLGRFGLRYTLDCLKRMEERDHEYMAKLNANLTREKSNARSASRP